MLEKFVTPSQLAAKLSITRQGVHKMIKEGKVRYEKIGKQFFIPRDEAERLATRAQPRKS